MSTHDLLTRLPKCEHHIHIEGTLSPTLLFELAHKNAVALPARPEYASPAALAEHYTHFAALQPFLDALQIGVSVLLTAADFERLAWAYFRAAHADGVVHAELSFDPQGHRDRGVGLDTVLAGLAAAAHRAQTELGISSCLVMCLMRDLGLTSALETFRHARGYIQDGVIAGIGLDSTEQGIAMAEFQPLYDLAHSYNVRVTAHAGEEGPAANVHDAVDLLGCARVDHGVSAAADPELVKHLAQKGTLLTICPISNVCLRVFGKIEDVPLPQFLKAGVRVSINSDDPAYFGDKGILACYEAVQDAFGWGKSEWEWICASSIEGSWISNARKAEIRAACDAVLSEWPDKT